MVDYLLPDETNHTAYQRTIMFNKITVTAQQSHTLVNTTFNVVETYNRTQFGTLVMGINGEILLKDLNILALGALDQDLLPELLRKANYLLALSFLKEQGYRFQSNVVVKEVK
jgi:hypothetical protein